MSKEPRKKGRSFLAKNAGTFGAKLLSLVAAVGFGAVVARVIGPEGKGVVALAGLVIGFVATFGTLSVELGNVVAIGKHREDAPAAVAGGMLVVLAAGGALLLLLYLFAPWRGAIGLDSIPHKLWLMTMLIIPFTLLHKLWAATFQALDDFGRFNSLNLLGDGLRVLFALVFVLALPFGVWGAVAAMLASAALASAAGLVMLFRAGSFSLVASPELLKRSLVYGLKVNLGNLMQFFNYRLDIFILNFILDVRAVGIYSVAVSMTELLWHISGSISATLLPRVASEKKKESAEFSGRVYRLTLLVTLLCALGIAALGYPAIMLIYGSKFAYSYTAALILLPGVWALGLAKVSVSYLMGRNLPRYALLNSLIAVAITIPLDIVLIARYGILGAAMATSLVYLTQGVITWYWMRKQSGVSNLLIPEREDFRLLGLAVRSVLGRG